MPGQPSPVGWNQGLPPTWNAVFQAIRGLQEGTNGLAGGAPAGWVTDQFGNVTELSGANLNQVVTIGAAYRQAGVLVSTGLPAGTAGRAVFSGPAITTINLTKGSTSATVGTVTGASLAQGQVIGAALVTDATTGTPTPAITPGTTIASVSGSSVTLSQVAAESGTGLYAVAGRFILQQDTGWIALTLATGMTQGGSYTPSARLRGDIVALKGAVVQGASGNGFTGIATLPAVMQPAGALTLSWSFFNNGTPSGYVTAPLLVSVISTGVLSVAFGSPATGSEYFLDGVTFSIA